jgi:proline iminopeptidase
MLRFLLLTFALPLAFGQLPQTKVARNGFDLYYREAGTGHPVVLLSGGPGFDCDYLAPVAHELAKSSRAILVELRGTGRSRPQIISRETINVNAYLDDLEALRAHLKLERWTVLGHSTGGVLAMYYAAAHPDRVDSLVLVGSAPVAVEFLDALMDNLMMRLSPERRNALATLNQPTGNSAVRDRAAEGMKIMLPAYFFDPAKATKFAALFGAEMLQSDVNQLLSMEMLRPGADLRPQLKDFSRPALLVYGRQDPLDARVAYETHLALKNSRLEFINRCGHFPWVEQPEQFYKIVEEFLATKGIAGES